MTMPFLAAAILLTAAAAGQAASQAGAKVSLRASGHAVRVGASWTYTVRATTAKGSPLAAVATVGVVGGKSTTSKFKGTLRKTIQWPTAGSFVFRAVVKAGGTSRTLTYAVTVSSPPPPPPPPGPPTGTQGSPVPLGQTAALTDSSGSSWRAVVGTVTPDAGAQVLGASDLNQPADPGKQYFMIFVTLTHSGDGLAGLGSLGLRALGASGTTYAPETDGCGQLPEPDLYFDNRGKVLAAGETVAGNFCFAVASADAASLVLLNDAGAGQSWLALR